MSLEHAIESANSDNRNPGCGALQREYLSITQNGQAQNDSGSRHTTSSDIVPPLELIVDNLPTPSLQNTIPQVDITNRIPSRAVDAASNPWPPIVDLNNKTTERTSNPAPDVKPKFQGSPDEVTNPTGISSPMDSAIDITCAAQAPGKPGPELMKEGHKQLKEALDKGQWPDQDAGALVLAMSLESYFDSNGKDFMGAFAKDSNDALQASPLKDKVKVGVGAATEKQQESLRKFAEKNGLKVEHSGVLELKDKEGKVTDRVVVGVLSGSGAQAVAVFKP